MITKHEKDWKILMDYKRKARKPVKGDRSLWLIRCSSKKFKVFTEGFHHASAAFQNLNMQVQGCQKTTQRVRKMKSSDGHKQAHVYRIKVS